MTRTRGAPARQSTMPAATSPTRSQAWSSVVPCLDQPSPRIATAPSSPSATADAISNVDARPGREPADATASIPPATVTTSGDTRAAASGRASHHITRSHRDSRPLPTSYPGCRAAHRSRRSSSVAHRDEDWDDTSLSVATRCRPSLQRADRASSRPVGQTQRRAHRWGASPVCGVSGASRVTCVRGRRR